MSLSSLIPETNRLVLELCEVEPEVAMSILSGMAQVRPPASVHAGQADIAPLPVTLRTVSRAGLQLHTLHWDESAHEVLDGGAATFVGLQGRYKVQFQIPRMNRMKIPPAKEGKLLEGSFFECRFPTHVWRINRREAFRAVPGLRTPVWCHINVPDRKPVIAKVIDIGMGGVGIELLDGVLDLAVGTIWPDCTLRLGDHRRVVHCTLRVTSFGGQASRREFMRVGCAMTLNDGRFASEFQMMIFDVQAGRRYT